MENEIKKDRITTDETLRETASHGSEEYPFSYYYEDIWDFDFHCIDWHWHPEVEFVYVQHGKADFLVGGNRYVLSSGDGIFINSQVIHRFEAEDSTIIPNIVFSPVLLAPQDSLIYSRYIRPIIGIDYRMCDFFRRRNSAPQHYRNNEVGICCAGFWHGF